MQVTYDWYVDVRRFRVTRETADRAEPTEEVHHALFKRGQSFQVTLRRILLDRLPGLSPSSLRPSHMRLSMVRRQGQVWYALSGRKETAAAWWDADQRPEVEEEYTALERLDRAGALRFLQSWIGADAERALVTCETLAPPRPAPPESDTNPRRKQWPSHRA